MWVRYCHDVSVEPPVVAHAARIAEGNAAVLTFEHSYLRGCLTQLVAHLAVFVRQALQARTQRLGQDPSSIQPARGKGKLRASPQRNIRS